LNVPFPEGWLEIVSSSLFTTSPVSMVLLNIFALEVPGKVDLHTVQNRPPWLCVKTSTLFSRNIQYHKENVQPPTRLTPFDDAIVSFNHPAKFWDPKKRLKKMVSKIFLKGRLTIPKI